MNGSAKFLLTTLPRFSNKPDMRVGNRFDEP